MILPVSETSLILQEGIMDFRDLTYILAVADNRSVTEAANKLYISQPSLSYIISKVEEELGVKLFYRKTNPITLTYAGQLYVETAREILAKMDNLKRQLTEVGVGEKGQISIGIPTERAGYMIPKFIGKFHDAFPEMELKLMETRSKEIISGIDKGRILLGILPGREEDYPANMAYELIYKEKIVMTAPEGMITPEMITGTDENGIAVVDLKKMKHLPYLIMQQGHYSRKKTDRIFKKAGFVPKNVTEVSSNMTALSLSANAGLGITIVPERAVETFADKDKLKIYRYSEQQDTWDINAVYKKDTYLGKAERALIDIIKETFN
ncbi:MAG: LysR family transcriptional regulator [Erysipelotrichaceae bacterium]|nr:LysR family transcriptional regulator [Erysipelotrichaceae bacterium]